MKRLLLLSNSTQHGRGYLDHAEEAIRSFLGKEIETVFFIPYAVGDLDGYAAQVRARFRDMGFDLVSAHEQQDPARAAREAQAFFTGGGNTFRLLEWMYRLKLLGPVRERVAAGAPYMGASAGTNLACVSIKTTNDMPIVWPPSLDALGLVPFNINPHYLDRDPASTHRGETREERIREFHELNAPPVLGLREGAWLRVEERAATLEGLAGARLFAAGRPPRELDPGERLDELLAAGSIA